LTARRSWGGARRLAAIVTALAAPASATAAPSTKIELLVIGNNLPYVSSGHDATLPNLRFADDDAAAFYELVVAGADASHLLTVMDADTQALYPNLVATARPPTLAGVRGAVADLAERIEANRRLGDRNVAYVFYSGHGMLRDEGGPALALLDGGISQQLLYDEVLAKLPADVVHLFVDACHAEAVVRPRDVDARPVRVPRAEADAFLARSTLARFPHIGAIVAAATDAQAHEWDLLRQGVFTHELLSALRGAADVNRDGRIEYSEIYAFLGSANRSVGDRQARLAVVARPPEIDRHVAVFDPFRPPRATTAHLLGVPAGAGLVQVEDGSGRRIASVRGEPGYLADLVVPAGAPVYVRAGGREARLEMVSGEKTHFDKLTFRDVNSRARGALEDAVRRGLFASEFGRGYYLGFIDQAPDFTPVTFSAAEVVRANAEHGTRPREPSPFVPGRLLVGGGASIAIARALDVSPVLHVAAQPKADQGLALALDLSWAQGGDISERRATLAAGWLLAGRFGRTRGWVGALAGGGLIAQTASGQNDRWSAVVAGGPVTGLSVDVTRRIALWTEGQLWGLAFRRDGDTAFTLAPGLFAGVALAL
jgi:hypothetical protein